MHNNKANAWDKVGQPWVALLLRPMDIVLWKAGCRCHLALHTFHCGFLGWPVGGKRRGGGLVWINGAEASARPEFVHFADMAAIEVYPTEGAAPTQRLVQTSVFGSLCLCSRSGPCRLWKGRPKRHPLVWSTSTGASCCGD